MTQEKEKSSPRIYVASLSDYNAGRLLGRWIDAGLGTAHIQAEIAAMLAGSTKLPAEAWAIHDYEGFGGLRLSEFESVDLVADVAMLLAEHGEWFGKFVQLRGGLANLADIKEEFAWQYRGAFKSLSGYVARFLDETYGDNIGGLPEFIVNHLDYDGVTRDLEATGRLFTIEHDGQVHVFERFC